jgi:hypothetical protein
MTNQHHPMTGSVQIELLPLVPVNVKKNSRESVEELKR